MRKRIILSLISIFAFVFFSCSGLLSDIDEDSSSNKAYVQIGDTSSRTVLPAALNTDDDMSEIKLLGAKDGGASSEILSATTYSELTGKTAEIEPGTWSFELQATINGKTFTDSTSCTNKQVSAGDTLRLTFSAMEASEDGDFYVKVNYEEREELSRVKVFLDDHLEYDSNVLSETESSVSVSWTKSSAIVSGPASSGDYKLKIEFYDGNSLWHTFREIIRVKGGLLSEAEYTITLNTSPSELLREQSRNLFYALRSASGLNIREAKVFKPATSAPNDGITTYPLDEDVHAVAWKDGETIYYYNPSSSTTKISLGSDANGLFADCSLITEIDMSGFDTSNVIDMGYMFNGCAALTKLDLSSFDTSNVRSMFEMFYGCAALTELDLSSFDTSNVESMTEMFHNCSALTTIYSAQNADWSSVSEDNSAYMFDGCTNLVGGKGTAYNDSNIRDATYARVDSDSNPGYFTVVGTEKTYSISVGTIVGGTVTVSAEDAKAGTEITLTPEAKAGYVFGAWKVTDASENPVPVTDNKFTMPASKVTVNATFTTIKDALTDGAVLKITFAENATVTFTRQADGSGSYTETHEGWPSSVNASGTDSIIRIEVDGGNDYHQYKYTLVIYTNRRTYTETLREYGDPGLQTIEVNGTDVLSTLTKSSN